MLKFNIQNHILQFKFEAGTSRGVLTEKEKWYLKVWDESNPEIVGIGECGPLKGLSIDDVEDFSSQLSVYSRQFLDSPLTTHHSQLDNFPAIRFGIETSLLDLHNGGKRVIFQNDFSEGKASIPINGLIWMGSKEFMLQQMEEKLSTGYTCLKMKIGAIDFETELDIIKTIRKRFSADEIMLRLDANGAFSKTDALQKLYQLAVFQIHSIEQPIRQGQWEEMSDLCKNTPIPIALDEELIGVYGNRKTELIEVVQPQFIILKPTLLGGFEMCDEWISLAEKRGIDWWITSALESNIGLNAICQYTYAKTQHKQQMPQGLGTGSLYHNNIASPLTISDGRISYNAESGWGDLSELT
jgi:O-succinylbenzoate synthase